MGKIFRIFILILCFTASIANAQDGNERISLKKYTPSIGNMGNAPAGKAFGWAVGYYAPAITFHLKPAELLSPYYLLDMLAMGKNCQLPDNYIQEAQRILKEGILKHSDYTGGADCTKRPDLFRYRNAPHYSINLSPVLTSKKNKTLVAANVLFAIRRRLNSGSPVIASIHVDSAFRNLKSGIWRPSTTARIFTQTVVVVGYDDFKKEVEVVLPWGKMWGNMGFGRISYEDLNKFTDLYVVSKSENYLVKGKVLDKAWKSAVKKYQAVNQSGISGILSLRTPVNFNANENVLYEDLEYVLDGGLMRARDKKPLSIGKQFQVVVDRATALSYLYAFSVDSEGGASILRPQNSSLGNLKTTPYPALVNAKETQILLPNSGFNDPELRSGKPRSFTKSTEGADFLIILHSGKFLTDQELLDIVSSLKEANATSDFVSKLKKVLGDKVIENALMQTKSGKLVYSAPLEKGYILPIIVRID